MAETIKDFLISLGWEVNEEKQKRFISAMREAQVQALLLADALEALARKAWEAISDIATAFDRLYFSSQRTGASVATIKDFGYAVKQLGGSAEAAQASLEAMGQKLRENPGNIAYINALGFGLNKITGQLEVQADKLAKFQQMPLAVAEQYRALAGEDERTFLAMRDPQVLRLMEEAAEARKRMGFDPDQAARDANEFMTTWRRTANDLSVIADDLFTKLMKALNGPFQEFQRFIEANGKEIGDDINLIATALGKMAEAWVKSFEEILKNPDSLKDFQTGMHHLAEDIKNVADFFHSFIEDLRWFNDKANGLADVLNKISGGAPRDPLKEPYSTAPGGTAGAVGSPGTTDDVGEGLGVDPKSNGVGFGEAWKRSSVGGWWNRHAPTWLGGGSPPAPSDHVSAAGPAGGKSNSNFTAENARALIASAKELGTTPEDLATVIGYETGGTFSPSIKGGKGGNYMGLIQFGPGERKQFGVDANQTVPEQLKSVVAYLKARGFKPGMGLLDLYSTINAGSPGHYGASDGNGTVAEHVQRMQRERAEQARAFVGMATGGVKTNALGERPPGFVDNPIPGKVYPADLIPGDMVGRGYTGPEKPGPTSWEKVQQDAAQGSAQIKAWESAKASPWGTLGHYDFGGATLGASGGDNTHINAPVTNHFNIDGANDPSIVAHMVAANQKRIVQDMTRNLIGAVN